MKKSFTALRWTAILAVAAGLMVRTERAAAQQQLGIDVSHYQDTVDWEGVAGSGLVFSWAKAAEGTNYIDPTFAYNAVNAKAFGILFGVYHFARPDVDLGLAGADAEAAFFWNAVSNYVVADGMSLMPVLDYETSPGSSYTTATSSQWVNEWCHDIVNYGLASGVTINPVIYCSASFAKSWLNTTVTNWPLWRTANGTNELTGAPNTSPWATWSFWQYGQGLNPGITNGIVDVDVFNGTDESIYNYVVSPTPAYSTATTLNSPAPTSYGEFVSLTATVTPAPYGGTVQFYDNGAPLGSALWASGGEVSYFTTFLPAGTNAITATFSGIAGYTASTTAAAWNQQVNPATLMITAGSVTKPYGTALSFGSGSTNFTVSGLENSETVGTVTLAVSRNGGASNAPPGTYAITPSQATNGTFAASNYDIIYNNGTLTVTPPSNSVPVTIVSEQVLTNGTVQLNFSGTPGFAYYIQAANQLTPPASWTTVATNTADTNGLFSFIDAASTNYQSRFYRTMLP